MIEVIIAVAVVFLFAMFLWFDALEQKKRERREFLNRAFRRVEMIDGKEWFFGGGVEEYECKRCGMTDVEIMAAKTHDCPAGPCPMALRRR